MAAVILPDIISGGLFMSTKPAMTKPQFATGPQKWVVLGPTGLLMKALSAVDMANDCSKGSPYLVAGRRMSGGGEVLTSMSAVE